MLPDSVLVYFSFILWYILLDYGEANKADYNFSSVCTCFLVPHGVYSTLPISNYDATLDLS